MFLRLTSALLEVGVTDDQTEMGEMWDSEELGILESVPFNSESFDFGLECLPR